MCCADGHKEYAQDDYLQLSGIQHFAFCRRQWALIHIEGQWADNVRTVSGELLHERAHDASLDSVRGGVITVRGMPVHSRYLGVSGACDVVEFHPDPDGVPLYGREGTYRPLPVEYKRGEPKDNDCDRLQLCAQAMCLEEMLAARVDEGALYYGETRRREKVVLDDALRAQVRALLEEMHRHQDRRHTPRPKRTQSCRACSLQDICLPALGRAKGVADYVKLRLEEKSP